MLNTFVMYEKGWFPPIVDLKQININLECQLIINLFVLCFILILVETRPLISFNAPQSHVSAGILVHTSSYILPQSSYVHEKLTCTYYLYATMSDLVSPIISLSNMILDQQQLQVIVNIITRLLIGLKQAQFVVLVGTFLGAQGGVSFSSHVYRLMVIY